MTHFHEIENMYCFIETRVEVWENEKCCGNTSRDEICSKNSKSRKIVPYHGCSRIPRLTVSVPDYGSCLNLGTYYNAGQKQGFDLRVRL